MFDKPTSKENPRLVVAVHNFRIRRNKPPLYRSGVFEGGCIDPGAHRSVCGKAQAEAYCHAIKTRMELQPSPYTFKFGDGYCRSNGKMRARLPTPLDTFISFDIDVVDADIPFLIGLELLDKYGLYANNVSNQLVHHNMGWSLPLKRKYGHMFVEWNVAEVLFTRKELQKLHEHFFHPSAEKLYKLLKRAKPHDLTPDTQRILDEISKSCASCLKYSSRPFRFRVSIPDESIHFNQELAIDLMYLKFHKKKRIPVLHVVDTQTHYQNAVILKGESAEDVWDAFMEAWVTTYSGFLSTVRTDRGSVFTSKYWEKSTAEHGIHLQLSGVQSHNSIGAGERYHAPLRRLFNVITDACPSLDGELALRYAVKGMNDTMGPEGLVPSLLVYGTLPRFPTPASSLRNQEERMRALEAARSEMAALTAKLRIQQALRSRLPPATKYLLDPGDNVLVYDEKVKHWHGPYPIIKVAGKDITVDIDGRVAHYNISHVIPNPPEHSDQELHRLAQGLNQFKSRSTSSVHITEILHPSDKRGNLQLFDDAKAEELAGLARRGVYEVVCREDLDPDVRHNIMGGRFALSIKDTETDNEVYKARFIVQGHTDYEKHMLVHNSTTLKQSSVRLLVAIAALFGYPIWSQDVSQAYLQSAGKLLRDIYVRPTKEFRLSENQLLKLLKPLYGLTDSGEYWNSTFANHLRNDLMMVPTAGDLSLFFRTINGKLGGATGAYVDDSISTGNNDFEKSSRLTEQRFDSKPRTYNEFKFAGIEISSYKNGYKLHQQPFASRIQPLANTATFKDFRSKRQELAWLIHTRPDIAASVNLLAQVTEAMFGRTHITRTNDLVRRIHATASRGIIQQKLCMDSLCIKVYSDSSFANTPSLHSQLGFLVALSDNSGHHNLIHYSSYRSRRRVRSVMGAELYAFADAFDFAYLLKRELERMLERHIPLIMYTDSDSVFKTLIKNTTTTEKRLMIDIQAAREAYSSKEISDIGWITGKDNPADGMTKNIRCKQLEQLLDTGKVDVPVQQWILR